MRLSIPDNLWSQMQADIEEKAPEEACGLLAGKVSRDHYQAEAVYPILNMLHSLTRYRMDPAEQLSAFNRMDAQNQDLVAIYHSHPQGPDGPSQTDIEEAYYPEAVYLIFSAHSGIWSCKGFLINGENVSEVILTSRKPG